MRIWTDKEKDFLRKYYPYGDKEFLIKHFNRNWSQIQRHASSLQIKRRVKHKHTQDTKEKISKNNACYWKGKHLHMYVRKKMSRAQTGKKQSPETIEKRRLKNIGKKRSEETKKKISMKNKGKTSWLKGKHRSEETKQKLRLANKGQIPWNKGKKCSIKTRRKISLKNKGKKHSEEAKRKMSIAKSKEKIDLSNYRNEIITKYNEGYNAYYIGKSHGVCNRTILRRLRSWGVKIKKSRIIHVIFTAQDGHEVKSNGELIIDNTLFSMGIDHIREKKILDTNLKCDWYIPESRLYIEYWGLVGKGFYDRKKERKLELYNNNGLNLLSIYPNDLRKLDKILIENLKIKK